MLRTILILQTMICLGSLAIPGLPGWKMFNVVQKPTQPLLDRGGREIEVVNWLPYPAYGYGDRDLVRAAPFICRLDSRLAPMKFGARTLSSTCVWEADARD